MIRRFIRVTFQKEGIHNYPAALNDPALADVKFLGYDHRHVFQFKVIIEVNHNDRDLEFIQLKRYCTNLYDSGTLQLGRQSCEMMGESLLADLKKRHPGR